MNNIYTDIISRLEEGQKLVLGTLLKTRGSTPQIPGATAIFNADGLVSGTLGGGIIEAEATKLSQEVVGTSQSVLEEINLSGQVNDKKGAICGGSATFVLDACPQDSINVFQKIKVSLEKRESGVLFSLVRLSKGQQVSVLRYWGTTPGQLPKNFVPKYRLGQSEILQILNNKKSQVIESNHPLDSTEEKHILFAEPLFPKSELLIVGAGHIGQVLCHLGDLSGFEVTVLDNRPELATSERLPDASRIIVNKIDEGFREVNITKNMHIVIVTQGHREDAEAMACCIQSEAAYIGMIGSKRKITLIREKLISESICTGADFDRVYAPIGIEIHSETVAEIAVSIIAQLIDIRGNSSSKPKKHKFWCVVLAAGLSSRMKKQKMLLPYEGSSIIETVVSRALASKADKVLVVTGSNKDEVEDKIKSLNAEKVENKFFKYGMLSSVRCGLNAIPQENGAVLILLGDQPMVKTEVINKLIDSYSGTGQEIIVPTFNGKRGHPLLIDLKYRDEINYLDGKIGLKELLTNHPDEIFEVEVTSDEILKDIDTPDDYKKITTD